ncbi:PEP-CTERM sorting domain-containing protein [Litorilituus sediminis]|uniref:PEP-CTERM sorting domain-containing protein n=1 Tax=Litorilituus sediminis TaxID=718192 RepID=UPI001FE4B196|nr:PEP-CTERM sorting domain-containing protein [Litorilituus sediminis]
MNIKMLKAALTSLILSVSTIANAGLIQLDGMGSIKEWVDLESTAGEMPEFIWGNSDSLNANKIGLYIELADGRSGSLVYSGVSGLWNSTFANLAPDIATGVFSSSPFLHFLFNTAKTLTYPQALPAAWSNATISGVTGNFDLSYYEQVGSNFRADIAGWERATITTYSSAYSPVDVPEPSTLAILSLGIMGLASRRFKKQS